MTRAVLLEQSADELVTASERLVDVATALRAVAVLLNVDTAPDKLMSAARTVQADVTRLVFAAVAAARAGERVHATVVLSGGGK